MEIQTHNTDVHNVAVFWSIFSQIKLFLIHQV